MEEFIEILQKEDCCGCGACAAVCPKKAISMKEDEAGFVFPSVDGSLCVACGKCRGVCVFKKDGVGENGEPEVYAASNLDENVLMDSSSGGVFTALAQTVLERGGAVFGAAWTEGPSLSHICVENQSELERLRGSKYVQSMTLDTFSWVKTMLREGRPVCYSGTPCQIAGLKAYLGKEYEDLFTVDLVCHGVPSMKMLLDDLKNLTKDNVGSVTDIRFRDKSRGWGVNGTVKSGTKKKKYNASTSPYYFYFLKGEVYRESCYHCRFPSENRQGDITLGDYWGIRLELVEKLGGVDPDKGISCVLVNTQKGKKWLDSAKDRLALTVSDRKSAEKRNHQLTNHSEPLPEHKDLLDGYVNDGYAAFKKGYKKHFKDHLVRTVKNMIPSKIKRKLNDLR